jgi:hypothetical protein
MCALTLYTLKHGLIDDFSRDRFPSRVSAWLDQTLSMEAVGTHFGFVLRGPAQLCCDSGRFTVGHGLYFSVPGAMQITSGRGIVFTRLSYRGFFYLGGPIEPEGRLRYIDGCSDSLLIPPVQFGDPCLNLLHLPDGVRQTPHTHPSLRAGVVVGGTGRCITADGQFDLSSGTAFMIRAEGLHCFHTDQQPLAVVAYHPDSDYGPTHENHPMINRTIVAEI